VNVFGVLSAFGLFISLLMIFQDTIVQECVQGPASGSQRNIDRSRNVVVFGISEQRNVNIWRQKVFNVLSIAAGRPVAMADVFRVGGKYTAGKVRPVVVKLDSVWDQREILKNSHRLKNYPDKIYVAADKSRDDRRRLCLDRMKERAERDGKSVTIVDGVLSIDGVATYSTASGRIVLPLGQAGHDSN
jgi:hypothetical protein